MMPLPISRGLAELRGRNAEWAVSAVTDAATLPATEALALNVIDIVADDLDDSVGADGRHAGDSGSTDRSDGAWPRADKTSAHGHL